MPLANVPVKLSNCLPPLVKRAVPLPAARPFSQSPDQLTLSPALAFASNSEQLELGSISQCVSLSAEARDKVQLSIATASAAGETHLIALSLLRDGLSSNRWAPHRDEHLPESRLTSNQF